MTESDALRESEYSALREEISTGLNTIRQLEALALTGVGALLAWLVTHSDAPPQGWWLPLALVAAAGLRALGTYNSIRLVGEYLRGKETALAVDEERWETWRKPRSSGLLIIACSFWGVLATITLIAAVWGHDWTHTRLPGKPGISLECSATSDSGSGFLLRCLPAPR